jgi:hypothetical protein
MLCGDACRTWQGSPDVKYTAQIYMDRLESTLRLWDWKGRKYRRFSLEFPVRIKVQSSAHGSEIDAISKNVSVGGLLVRTTFQIPEHTPVTFVLTVHGEEAVRPIHLVGEGEIVRVESVSPDTTFMIAVKCKAPVMQLEEYLPV